MIIRSFNAELAMSNLMFLKPFSNIYIERSDNKGTQKVIKVPCQLGQKSRILKNFQNADKKAMMKLPMIIVERTGYTRNAERLNSMHNEVKYELTSKYRKYPLLTPVPIDISYDLTVCAKYPSDIDQIASNFMVFFNPDVYVTCNHPKYDGIQLNNQIIMSDSVSEEHPSELDGTADDFITTTFQFTFKTYLFGGTEQAKRIPSKVLSSVVSSFISSYSYELTQNDITNISSFLSSHPYPEYKLSTILNTPVEMSVNIEVDNPELSDQVYDGFVPIIKNFNIGFYAVPQLCDYAPYIEYVESLEESEQWPHVDRVIWNVQDDVSVSL